MNLNNLSIIQIRMVDIAEKAFLEEIIFILTGKSVKIKLNDPILEKIIPESISNLYYSCVPCHNNWLFACGCSNDKKYRLTFKCQNKKKIVVGTKILYTTCDSYEPKEIWPRNPIKYYWILVGIVFVMLRKL